MCDKFYLGFQKSSLWRQNAQRGMKTRLERAAEIKFSVMVVWMSDLYIYQTQETVFHRLSKQSINREPRNKFEEINKPHERN